MPASRASSSSGALSAGASRRRSIAGRSRSCRPGPAAGAGMRRPCIASLSPTNSINAASLSCGAAWENSRFRREARMAGRIVHDAHRAAAFRHGCSGLAAHRLKPFRIQVQHLVAPRGARHRVAGMHAPGRHEHQHARTQRDGAALRAREHAASTVHRADRERGVQVGPVAGAAAAGTAAFGEGQRRVAPEGLCRPGVRCRLRVHSAPSATWHSRRSSARASSRRSSRWLSSVVADSSTKDFQSAR